MLFSKFFLITLAIGTVSCGVSPFAKKKKKKVENIPIEYFFHGDPAELIRGATLNKYSFLSKSNINQFGQFHLTDFTTILEYSEEDHTDYSQEDIEADRATSTADPIAELEVKNYSFNYSNGFYDIQPIDNHTKNNMNPPLLRFATVGDTIKITSLLSHSAEAIHYSISDDHSSFSFLLALRDERGFKILASLVFAKSTQEKPITFDESKNYQFLFASAKIRWEEDATLSICDSYTKENRNQAIVNSIAEWFPESDPYATPYSAPLGEHTFHLEIKKNYPPFSDVNTHCIYLVEGFKLENTKDYYVEGATLSNIHGTEHKIFDSDIFIFEEHVYVYGSQKNPTIMHEFGHFLGLGHEFEKDELGLTKNRSIMSYDSVSNVTNHDLDALSALYGE